MAKKWMPVFCLAMVVFGLLGLCGCRRGGKKPNIILISIDALRADYLGCYGYPKPVSPNIDAFAADAALFEECYSHAPDTRLSFATIFSGYHPFETKVNRSMKLPSGVDTLAEKLKRHGYATMAVMSNFVMYKGQGYEQGFDIYDDEMDRIEPTRFWPDRGADKTADRAIEVIDGIEKKPFFLWVHFQDPHGPYTPPLDYYQMFEQFKTRDVPLNESLSGVGGIPSYQQLNKNSNYYFYRAAYEGESRFADDHVKRLLDKLKAMGIYEDSLIILTSDHGEGMGEHDYYFAHGETLYKELVHVPLLVRYGERFSGRRSEPVGLIDLMPTILEFAGLKPDSKMRGANLVEVQPADRTLYMEMQSPLIEDGTKAAVVRNNRKLIYSFKSEQYELYDLAKDPCELTNLFGDPQYLVSMNELRNALYQTCREDRLDIVLTEEDKRSNFSEEIRERLRSLGYLK